MAKSAKGTGSVAHRPRVRVSQRGTEGASYRGGRWGEDAETPSPTPPPATRRRCRQPLAAGDTFGHKDLVPPADPSFSLRPGGSDRVARESRQTDAQTDRRTLGPRHSQETSYFLRRDVPGLLLAPQTPSRRVSGETLGKLRPPWGAAPRERGFARDPRRVARGGGSGILCLPGPFHVSPLALWAMEQGTGWGWFRIQDPELEFSV